MNQCYCKQSHPLEVCDYCSGKREKYEDPFCYSVTYQAIPGSKFYYTDKIFFSRATQAWFIQTYNMMGDCLRGNFADVVRFR